jgi:hypothetical protein
MLVRFLEQNGGTLSKRARTIEFLELKDNEVVIIESAFRKFLKFDGTKISQCKRCKHLYIDMLAPDNK